MIFLGLTQDFRIWFFIFGHLWSAILLLNAPSRDVQHSSEHTFSPHRAKMCITLWKTILKREKKSKSYWSVRTQQLTSLKVRQLISIRNSVSAF